MGALRPERSDSSSSEHRLALWGGEFARILVNAPTWRGDKSIGSMKVVLQGRPSVRASNPIRIGRTYIFNESRSSSLMKTRRGMESGPQPDGHFKSSDAWPQGPQRRARQEVGCPRSGMAFPSPKEIDMDVTFERIGAELVKKLSKKADDVAGDGTCRDRSG